MACMHAYILCERKIFKMRDYYYRDNTSTDLKTKKEEKWMLDYYSSYHKILLVGEGDFSFACSLADAFASAANMVATSLDSKEELLAKYSTAAKNLATLESHCCTIIHEVNAHTMSDHPLLCRKAFDFIIFNFPHAGFIYREHSLEQIKLHQELVRGFLRSASKMLAANGEIHITHKTVYPFNCWNVVELAAEVGLGLVSMRPFFRWVFTGYMNKKGSGQHCNRTFPVGDASTYMFKKLESNFT